MPACLATKDRYTLIEHLLSEGTLIEHSNFHDRLLYKVHGLFLSTSLHNRLVKFMTTAA